VDFQYILIKAIRLKKQAGFEVDYIIDKYS